MPHLWSRLSRVRASREHGRRGGSDQSREGRSIKGACLGGAAEVRRVDRMGWYKLTKGQRLSEIRDRSERSGKAINSS